MSDTHPNEDVFHIYGAIIHFLSDMELEECETDQGHTYTQCTACGANAMGRHKDGGYIRPTVVHNIDCPAEYARDVLKNEEEYMVAPELAWAPAVELYSVSTSTDLTEGRGYDYPFAWTENIITAARLSSKKYVQSTDCPVARIKAFKIDGRIYAPVRVEKPSVDDINKKTERDRREYLLNKAREAGFSDEELKILAKLSNG